MALSESAVSALLDALRVGEGTDLVRELAQWALQQLIEAEASETIGAGRYERTEGRVTERNGTRPKVLSTKAGDLALAIPKLRKGSFFPELLEPRRRIDQALYAVVMEAYVNGVSTRSVDDLVAAMGVDTGISKSEVSRICAGLDERVEAFRGRTLGHTAFPYVYLDATYINVRDDALGQVVSRAVVIATGITANGDREILGVDICGRLGTGTAHQVQHPGTRPKADRQVGQQGVQRMAQPVTAEDRPDAFGQPAEGCVHRIRHPIQGRNSFDRFDQCIGAHIGLHSSSLVPPGRPPTTQPAHHVAPGDSDLPERSRSTRSRHGAVRTSRRRLLLALACVVGRGRHHLLRIGTGWPIGRSVEALGSIVGGLVGVGRQVLGVAHVGGTPSRRNDHHHDDDGDDGDIHDSTPTGCDCSQLDISASWIADGEVPPHGPRCPEGQGEPVAGGRGRAGRPPNEGRMRRWAAAPSGILDSLRSGEAEERTRRSAPADVPW